MKRPRLDIVKYRWFWIGISLAITVPGLVAVIACLVQFHAPLKPGIDFTGGWLLQYQFARKADLQQVRNALRAFGLEGAQVQQAYVSNQEITVIRTDPQSLADESQKRKLDETLAAKLGSFKVVSVDKVSATIGPELLTNGLLALFVAFAMMVAYISYRYMFDYAVCAIIALFHDVLVLCGIFAIMGLTIGTEVDSLFISAVLTVIGFSVHDTIVVFDRIRENAKYVGSKATNPFTGSEYRKSFGDIANDSVNQTFARSIYTSLTVVITLSCLYFLGGVTTRDFVLAMLIGIISGTYSSIFNASCLLVLWRELKAKRRAKPA